MKDAGPASASFRPTTLAEAGHTALADDAHRAAHADASSFGRQALAAVAIAAASRLAFFLFYLLGRNIEYLRIREPVDHSIRLFTWANVEDVIGTARAYADYAWYASVGADGWERIPFDAGAQHNWVFFPLGPGLVRLIGGILPQFVVGQVFFLAGILLLLAYARRAIGPERAMTVVLFACFSPYAASLGQFRPEAALFLAFAALFYASSVGRLSVAVVALLAAGLAKPNGVAALVVALPAFWARLAPLPDWRRLGALGLLTLAGLAGILAMCVICYMQTGEPLAWSRVQVAWGHAPITRPLRQIYNLLTQPRLVGRGGWDLELFDWAMLAGAVYAILLLVRAGLVWPALMLALMILITFYGFGNWLMMKHLAGCPPLFVGLALAHAGGLVSARDGLLILSSVLFGCMGVLIGAGLSAAQM